MERLKLENKNILVTGASRGIGRSIALTLAEEGARIFISGRSLESLQRVKEEIIGKKGTAICLPVDLEKPDSAETLIQELKEHTDVLDILINNAGAALSAPIEESRPQDWDRIMNLNARTPYFLCRSSLSLMEHSEIKTIINIASVVAVSGYPYQSIYTASKHALIGFSKSLARELQEKHYRIHVISPGGVATEMVTGVRPDINTNELIAPEELAEWVKFLLTIKGNGMVDHIQIRRESKLPW